jgi:uncharacterized protein
MFHMAASAPTMNDTTSSSIPRSIHFSVGLENGRLLQHVVSSICQGDLQLVDSKMSQALQCAYQPIQRICDRFVSTWAHDTTLVFQGIDTSFNPSIEANGSIAQAIEGFSVCPTFGTLGTLAAVAAITTCIQHLEGLKLVGYCGLMLPVCEDLRLVDLASSVKGQLRLLDLLNVSNVCGVGIDTVPLPGDIPVSALRNLLLDVVALSERWTKPLSCRVFPVPGKTSGEYTSFDSPHLVNSRIMDPENKIRS